MNRIRVLVVDDHTVVRTGIQLLISTEPIIQVIGEAKDGGEAVRQTQILQPDIILMDLVMPQGGGIEAIAQIKRRYPKIKIIVLTTYEDKFRINAALEAGADGYLLKDADGVALLQAIQAAQQGGLPLHPRVAYQVIKGKTKHDYMSRANYLTAREKEVLQLVARGLDNKDVAQTLNLSESTVKTHVSKILSKLNVSGRIEAAIIAVQIGLVLM
jgi:DNA-binding NarL/FixJ family response regulator